MWASIRREDATKQGFGGVNLRCKSRGLLVRFAELFCRSGEIGRRARLRIWYGETCAGSIPVSGTTEGIGVRV